MGETYMTLIDMMNPYAWVMTLRRILYHKGTLPSTKVSVPVISIGNITSGGSGKSPMTKLIAEYLRDELQKKPAIVMRGYKRKTKGFLLVSDGRQVLANVRESGDEAQSFARELGGVMVVCDEDRVHGANEAIKRGANVILLDDGFQHMALKRDLNILLFDKYSFSHVIPFGKNREDITSCSDADIIITTDGSTSKPPEHTVALHLEASPMLSKIISIAGEAIDPSSFSGKRVLALSSIANPIRFQNMLAKEGADVIPFTLNDHSEYNETIITDIIKRAKDDLCEMILTTTKDIVKSREFFEKAMPDIPVCVLHITYTFDKPDLFYTKLNETIVNR